MNRLRAFVQSVEDSRNIFISVNCRENGTVEFELQSGQDSELVEAKSDIQGEVCSVRISLSLSLSLSLCTCSGK